MQKKVPGVIKASALALLMLLIIYGFDVFLPKVPEQNYGFSSAVTGAAIDSPETCLCPSWLVCTKDRVCIDAPYNCAKGCGVTNPVLSQQPQPSVPPSTCSVGNWCDGDNLMYKNSQCDDSFIGKCADGCVDGACKGGLVSSSPLPSPIPSASTCPAEFWCDGKKSMFRRPTCASFVWEDCTGDCKGGFCVSATSQPQPTPQPPTTPSTQPPPSPRPEYCAKINEPCLITDCCTGFECSSTTNTCVASTTPTTPSQGGDLVPKVQFYKDGRLVSENAISAGDKITLYVSIANIGKSLLQKDTGVVTTFNVLNEQGQSLLTDRSSEIKVESFVTVTDLLPGSEKLVHAKATFTAIAGVNTVIVNADSTNAVSESNEDNNRLMKKIDLTPGAAKLPDLIVPENGISFAPSDITVGKELTSVFVTVKNAGQGVAQGFLYVKLSVLLAGQEVCSDSASEQIVLQPGQQKQFWMSPKVGGQRCVLQKDSSEYVIKAVVDPCQAGNFGNFKESADGKCEGSERNEGQIPLKVGAQVSQPKCSPVGDRTSRLGSYCSFDGNYYEQRYNGQVCKQNFECRTNECFQDKCISYELITKINSKLTTDPEWSVLK